MELDERLVEAYNNISEAGYNGDEEEHTKYKQELLQLEIDDAEQLYIIAQHFMHGLGEYDIAKALLLKIQQDDAFYGQACIVLSDIERYGYENYDGAFAVLDQAIANGAAKDNVLFAKARIYVDLEQYQEALNCLEQIDAANFDNYANVLNWYLVVYYSMDNMAKVAETFALADEKYKDDMSYPAVAVRYAKYLKAKEQYQTALTILDKVPVLTLEYLEALDEYAAIYRQLEDEALANKYQKWKHILEKVWATDGRVNSALWADETALDELQFWQQIPNQSLEYYYAQMRMAFVARDLGEFAIAKQLLDAIPAEGKEYIAEEYEYDFDKINAGIAEKLADLQRPATVPAGAFFDKKDSIWVLGTKNDIHAYVGEVAEWDQDGTLTEKAFYTGDEGDTVTFKIYNQADELTNEGAWVDGLMTENIHYRCQHDNKLAELYEIDDEAVVRLEVSEFALLSQSIAVKTYDKDNQLVDEEDYRDGNEFPEGYFDDATRKLMRAYGTVLRGTYALLNNRLAEVSRENLKNEDLLVIYDGLQMIASHVSGSDIIINDDFIAKHNMLDNFKFKQFNVAFESFIKVQARNYLAMIVNQDK